MTKITFLTSRKRMFTRNQKAFFLRFINYNLLFLFFSCAIVLGIFSITNASQNQGICLLDKLSNAIVTNSPECKEEDGKILIDFEGIPNQSPISNAYSACGAYFSDDSLGIIDSDEGGTGNFANEPSPNTILFFLDDDRATLNFPAGIVNGFSFYYCSIAYTGFIKVYSEENRQGEILATLDLPKTPSLGQGDPSGAYDNWKKIGVEFDGVAKSIDFGGTANQIGFDNITLNSAEPAGTKVDHFQFSDIDDQEEDVFFEITITALDQYENRVTTFNKRADLTTYIGDYVVFENENGALFVNLANGREILRLLEPAIII